jgi:hypothetical protein
VRRDSLTFRSCPVLVISSNYAVKFESENRTVEYIFFSVLSLSVFFFGRKRLAAAVIYPLPNSKPSRPKRNAEPVICWAIHEQKETSLHSEIK